MIGGSEGFPTATRIYRNDGEGVFALQNNISLLVANYGSVAWGDYNNDGYLDILLAGSDVTGSFYTKIYKNNGNSSFEEQTNINLRGLNNCSVKWGDYDNDGDLDIIMSGENRGSTTLLYINEGNNIFTELDFNFLDLKESSVALGDYDNDGDLDILLAGMDNTDNTVSKIYRNNGNWENTNPTTPGNLQYIRNGYGALLNWSACTDNETPEKALTYNVRVGTKPDSFDIVSPMSIDSSGFLLTPQMGNSQLITKKLIDSLPEGTYYWSVQAIDQGFFGGEWADEQTFNITVIRADFTADTICKGDTTQFTDNSLSGGTSITEWEWNFGDGLTSNLQHPKHKFQTSGSFNVQLIAIGGGYSDTINQIVEVSTTPQADFIVDEVCLGTATNFVNSSVTDNLTVASWYWDFDDGTYSINETPLAHSYSAGTFNAKLKVMATNNCSDSIIKVVKVGVYPNATISLNGNTEFCSDDSAVLFVDYNSQYSYTWKINTVEIAGEISDTLIVTENSGDYAVQVSNPVGNCVSNSIAVPIIVNEKPIAPFEKSDKQLFAFSI